MGMSNSELQSLLKKAEYDHNATMKVIQYYKSIGVDNTIIQLIADLEARLEKIRAYRKEASRLAALANKRAQRLEQKELTDSPAYKKYIEDQPRFGVKGKNHEQLVAEVMRLRAFIDAETSTVTGASSVLKTMAANTGIEYSDFKDLQAKAKVFFELHSKVEEYMRLTNDAGSALGYQEIWEAINQYMAEARQDVNGEAADVEAILEKVNAAIAIYEDDSPKRQTFNTTLPDSGNADYWL